MPFVREQSGGTPTLHTYKLYNSDIRGGVTLAFDISDIDATGSIPIENMGIGVVTWNEASENAGWYNLTAANFYIVSNNAGIVSVYIKSTGNPQRVNGATVALYVAD